MTKSNDVTGDRITNALKGDKEKYREGWDKIFGGKSEEEVDKDLSEVMAKVYDKILDESEPIDVGIDSKKLWDIYEE